MIGKIVKCIYNFPAETETDLEINIGDLIQITKVINSDWCEGQLHDKKGQFPTAYIEECDDVFDLAVAIRSFAGDQEGDLAFNSGDYIVITEIVDENWMQGYIQGGSHGLFPRAFVKQILLDDPNFCEEKFTPSENISAVVDDTSAIANGTSVATHYTPVVDKQPELTWVDVLENFSAMDATELDLFVGTKVRVLCDVDDFWCKGISEGGKEGIFPRNFVDLPQIVEDKKYTIVETNENVEKIQCDVEGEVEVIPETNMEEFENKKDEKEIEVVIGRTVALYTFSGAEEGDLSFTSGDEVLLLEKINENWMRGKIEKRIGIFPSNYVEVKEIYPIDETCMKKKTVSSESSERKLIQQDNDTDDYINVETLDSEMKSAITEVQRVDNEADAIYESNLCKLSTDATYENTSISPRRSPQSPSLPDTHKKTPTKPGKPQRPKLPDSKKPIDEVTPFSYQFKTKSQPLVIIPTKYFKQGSSSIVILKNWKNEKFTENIKQCVNGEGINGD